MKKFLAVLAMFCVFAVIFGLSACSGGGSLRMATEAGFEPFEYYEGQDIVGIDVDIVNAIAKELNQKLEITDMDFDSVLVALSADKADIIAAGITVDEDRKQNMDFTIPYYNASQVIIIRGDSDIKTADDLAGKKIAVQLGTTGDDIVSEMTDVTIQRNKKFFEAVEDLKLGRVDAVVMDNFPAKIFIDQNPNLVMIEEPLSVEEYAIGVKKGNTSLLNTANKVIQKLIESGEMDRIISKYTE